MDTLVDYLSRVARYDWWIVVVELVLIGLIVYWVVDFLEGTRGERLFRGVIFILVAGVLIQVVHHFPPGDPLARNAPSRGRYHALGRGDKDYRT